MTKVNTVPSNIGNDDHVYTTVCCGFTFHGLNHSPEENGICRHCGKSWDGIYK